MIETLLEKEDMEDECAILVSVLQPLKEHPDKRVKNYTKILLSLLQDENVTVYSIKHALEGKLRNDEKIVQYENIL